MATAYYADNYKTEPMCDGPGAGLVLARTFVFTVTAAFVVNDTVKLCPLQGASLPGFTLLGFVVDIPDLDSSTGIVLELGDDDTADRFVTTAAAGTIGQVAGRFSSFAAVGTGSNTVAGGGVYGRLPVSYTANKSLILTVQTAPTTGATSGTIKGQILYSQFGIRSV